MTDRKMGQATPFCIQYIIIIHKYDIFRLYSNELVMNSLPYYIYVFMQLIHPENKNLIVLFEI